MKSTTKKILSVLMIVVLICALATGCTPAETGPDTTIGGNNWTSIVMLFVVIVVFYFMIMRPEKKKQKQQDDMRSALSVGDEITTIGGIVGKIVSVHEDTIVFETSEDRVRLEVTRWAVSSKK